MLSGRRAAIGPSSLVVRQSLNDEELVRFTYLPLLLYSHNTSCHVLATLAGLSLRSSNASPANIAYCSVFLHKMCIITK